MPHIQVANESNKTVLTNLPQIAKSLYRDPSHIVKFLGSNLGCTQIKDGARFLLNGRFDAQRIQSTIYDFIDTFVLCPACKNPETRFVFDEELKRVCSSCGAISTQPPHRLNTVIARDIGSEVNEDTKYDKNNGADIASLLRGEEDNSDRLYDLFCRENIKLSDFLVDYLKPSHFKQLSKVLKEFSLVDILANIEIMLENAKKDEKIDSFLKALYKLGYSIDGMCEYFSVPRKGKKRSPLIKKNAEYFFSNFDE